MEDEYNLKDELLGWLHLRACGLLHPGSSPLPWQQRFPAGRRRMR